MKKLLFIAAVAVLGLTNVNAQEETTSYGFQNGDLYVSGEVGFTSYKQGDAKSNQFTFSPSLGYFVSDHIALELGLIVGSGKNTNDDKTNVIGGEFGAIYYCTPSNQFSFTVGAGFAYQSYTFKPSAPASDSKTNAFGFAVSPGLSYFVSKNVALRGSIGAISYSSSKQDFDGAEAVNQFNINLDLSDFNLGVVYKF
jgi:opacity protein-like surface antigen